MPPKEPESPEPVPDPAGAGWAEGEADHYIYAGKPERAKDYYGLAIDAYIEAEQYEQALRVSEKLLRVAPDTVRVHLTLAFLRVGLGQLEEARAGLQDYVQAVRGSRTQGYAVPRLILLGQASDDSGFRQHVSHILGELGASESEIKASSATALQPLDTSSSGSARTERWKRLLHIGVKDNR